MSNLKFSVIVPVYNTESLLPRCVDSVLCQTFADYEILLIDDGSRDDSGKLCDGYAEKDGRIKSIHKQNGGSSSARNLGIEKAEGEYLLFLDSDDAWDDRDALKNIAEISAKGSPDLICFGTVLYNEDGTVVKERLPVLPSGCGEKKREVLTPLIYTNQYFSACYVKCVKRELVKEKGLFFPTDLTSGEDIFWSAEVIRLCKSIAVYSSSFYKRIMRNSGSITSSIGKKNVFNVLDAIERGIKAIKENRDTGDGNEDLYYEYWAYNYAMLLGLAQRIKKEPEFNDTVKRLKNLKWLLRYDHVKKVRLVKTVARFLGIRAAMKIVDMHYKAQ